MGGGGAALNMATLLLGKTVSNLQFNLCKMNLNYASVWFQSLFSQPCFDEESLHREFEPSTT